MSKTKFFNDAIAEAKAIRETAFNNAKLSLAESFAPQIQNMLSHKLNEMEEELDENQEEEVTLEQLLQELEGSGSSELDENTEEEEPIQEEAEADDEVGEITVDDLKDIIRDVMIAMGNEGGEDEEIEEPAEETEEIEGEEDEETDLNEELANSAAAGADELLRLIQAAISKTPEVATKIASFLKDLPSGAGAAMRNEVQELEEAKKTIVAQSKTLKEMNLLNSQLLYVNKIFKAKNLTEGQKVKVINAFDRAKTVKETENIFLTLKESLITAPTKPLIENKGRASKALGGNTNQTQKPEILTEEVNFVSRMQKLAGII